ncbi:MAG: HIT domain-containing protein [Bryobacteraceae bacterium]
MDRLWSPWRYQYVGRQRGDEGCIFCDRAAAGGDRENLIVHRGRLNYVILNRYPYAVGHLMVAPYAHAGTLEDTPPETATEMMMLTREAERILRAVYRPEGLNIGMNIGACAGAGVAGHVHMHVLPRWTGDANFMTTVGETRVLPEDLGVTWEKLHEAFANSEVR